ncbi:MAG: sugar nucleotide-binding protein [Patescibacteria group bacterium]|jgi:dTDP-4-dehydrorhamnose reductase
MSNILIFGAGYLGQKFADSIPGSVLTTADISDGDAVREALETFKPDAVLNTAGKTGKPNVDWCEDNKIATMRSNVVGALVLAEACAEANVHMTHLGSGCIFYGPSPDPKGWRETAYANPSAFYSRTKYAADIVLSDLPNVAVARLRMPIDGIPGPRNLITKLANYPKIIDVENSVTVIDDLVKAILVIVEKKATGVFHTVNEGTMKHRDLIALYEEIVDPAHTNEWIPNDDLVKLGLATKGRSNCILQNARLKEIGVEMRPISVALRDCMEQYAAAIKKEKSLTT